MLIYAILGGFIFYVASLGAVWYEASTGAVDKYKAKEAAQQAKLDEMDAKLKQEADNHISDMETAYAAGEQNAQVVTRTIYVKGQTNVAKDSGLSNPSCVMSADSLQLLRSALSGMRTATYTGDAAGAVPGTGAADGGNVQRALPQQPQEHGAVGGVHPPAGKASGAGQVPSVGLPAHPKPQPIGK